MPRTKRVQVPNLLRHVVSRGNGRMRIFCNNQDYRKFLSILTNVAEDYQVEVWDICIMPNHFHLAVVNRLENLSDAMHELDGEYASWWNARYKHVGHVFQGRFKDQIVQDEDYLRSLVRYIALNPVRARLVKKPEDWPCSAYRYTAGLADAPPYLSCAPVLERFGSGELATVRERYVRHVLRNTAEEAARVEAFRSRQRIVGTREFKRAIRTLLSPPDPTPAPALIAAHEPLIALPGFI